MPPQPEPLWAPSPERAASSNMRRFMRQAGAADYEALHRWSVESPEAFWGASWSFLDIRASNPPDRVVDRFDLMPGATWFPGARLNFAENLLSLDDSREALVSWTEDGRRRSLTYHDLRLEVGALAAALADAGVGPADRVAGYVANIPEAVTAMLATTSLGAIWTSCSPDFGADAVKSRFGQIEPTVLFAVDGYRYAGQEHDCAARLREIARSLSSVERVVVIPHLHVAPDLDGLRTASLYEDFLGSPQEPRFEQLPFDHPCYVLYSSGTTGKPKCIVHGAGGTLIQQLKELVLHTDLAPRDRIFFFTSCGWMMWNWLVSGLAVGATVVLYDGSPFHPWEGSLFDLADRESVSVFGAGARYFSEIEKAGLEPVRSHRLAELRTILSTGSPLADESFGYVYRAVRPDVQLSSISGGTDIVSCFALGNPAGPVFRGELQVPGLGMRVEVFGDDGRSLPVGEKGELVCTRPFPSMPIGFWNDPGGARYRAAYFERFPGVWHHGDFCERTPSGGFRIWGRSDTVLNPGGVRIGTAEIYAVVEAMDQVVEALAVGWQQGSDEKVVLLVRLPAGVRFNDALVERIRGRLRRQASPRHVPAHVFQVDAVPKTRSGKIAELAARNVLHGRRAGNFQALENSECLDALMRIRERLVSSEPA
ncbi:MAG: acetoacetate--CoA ligase [Bryobacterales bacterium]|nr:acetoacetate--CoA ligase [Bryobacterales bacterium]